MRSAAALMITAVLLAAAVTGCLGTTDPDPGSGGDEAPQGPGAVDPVDRTWTRSAQAHESLGASNWVGECTLFKFHTGPTFDRALIAVQAPPVNLSAPSVGATNLTLEGPDGARVPMPPEPDGPDLAYRMPLDDPAQGTWRVVAGPAGAGDLDHTWTATFQAKGHGEPPEALTLNPGDC